MRVECFTPPPSSNLLVVIDLTQRNPAYPAVRFSNGKRYLSTTGVILFFYFSHEDVVGELRMWNLLPFGHYVRRTGELRSCRNFLIGAACSTIHNR